MGRRWGLAADIAIDEDAVAAAAKRLGTAKRPVPKPGVGELLIKVAAAGINGADLLQREGRYPLPPGSPPPSLRRRSFRPALWARMARPRQTIASSSASSGGA